MIKKLFLTAALALPGSLHLCAEEKPQPTQRKQIIAQVSAGSLSSRNEKLVRDLLQKYDFDTSEITIIQPSKLAIELNPGNSFASYNDTYKLFYVNEHAFNKLPNNEKEALIAAWAVYVNNIPNNSRRGWILLILFFVIEFLIAFALYKYLGKNTNLSRFLRFLIAFGVYIVLDVLDEVWKTKYYQPYLRFSQDKEIVEKIGSKEGFLSLLKRRQKELPALKKTANALYWATYETTLVPRIKYLESLEK